LVEDDGNFSTTGILTLEEVKELRDAISLASKYVILGGKTPF